MKKRVWATVGAILLAGILASFAATALYGDGPVPPPCPENKPCPTEPPPNQ